MHTLAQSNSFTSSSLEPLKFIRTLGAPKVKEFESSDATAYT
jgi:hypothetical protein